MRNKVSPLYVIAIVDVVLGLLILCLSIFFKMELSDFMQGFCTGIAVVLTLGGVFLLVRHFINKKPITI